jgi:hypothetical protein
MRLIGENPLPNAAATRAYYAAYHACWYALENQGYPVPNRNGKMYWPHDTFADETLRLGLLDDDESESLAALYSARVLADYFPDGLSPEQARELAVSARAIIDRVLRNG